MMVLNIKNLSTKLLGLFALALVFSLTSCKKCKDPCNIDCDNYDPCCGQTAADASFTIYEILNGPSPTLESEGYTVTPMATDTILRFNTALMEADFDADYYEWSIGDDPRTWNTREVALNFGVQFYMPIPITLKVAKAVDKSCFPNAQDTMTFQRTLVVVPEEDSKVVGRYEGVLLSSPSKPNFLEIIDSIHPRYGDPIYGHSGIVPSCDMPAATRGRFYVGYRSFYLDTRPTSIGCCFGLNGYGKLQQDGSFSMKLVHHPYNPADSCVWGGIGDPTIVDKFSANKTL